MDKKVLLDSQRFALKLYRAILRSHKICLPTDLRRMGDLYVREEFRLHYKAKPEHLSPFFSQWLDYLDMMKQQQTQLFSSSATTGAAEAKEPAHGEEQVLGRDLEPEQMLMFSEEQMDQLDALRSEAFRIEGKNPDGGK